MGYLKQFVGGLFFTFACLVPAAKDTCLAQERRDASANQVRISYSSPSVTFVPVEIARRKGFFQEEGLAAELLMLRGPTAMAALLNGEIQYTFAHESAMRARLNKGLPFKVILYLRYTAMHALLAKPEYKFISELRGKILASSSPGAGEDTMVKAILKQHGLDPDSDVKRIYLGNTEARLQALRAGVVAATLLGVPASIQAKMQGYNLLADVRDYMELPGSGLTTTETILRDKSRQVMGVLRALVRALRFVQQNKEETLKVYVDWLKLNRDAASASYEAFLAASSKDGDITEKGLNTELQLLAQQSGKKVETLSHSAFIDFSHLHQVQRELAVKR